MQAVQLPPLGPVYPALHLQAEILLLAGWEIESTGHGKQTDESLAPFLVEYFPTEQPMQDDEDDAAAESAYVPATQSMHAVADAPECLPAAQSLHVATLVAPVAAEYFPEGHGVQRSWHRPASP
jgi:hypothetical protein